MKLDVSGADFQSIFQQLANTKTIEELERVSKQVQCEDFGRCNCLKGHCDKGPKT